MLKVVIVGYGEMFTNLIAAALDAECEIVGVLRKDVLKYNPFIRRIKDLINPSVEYNYIKSYNIPEITGVKGVNDDAFRRQLIKLNVDILLVGSWGEKFEKSTYDIPKLGAINAHPSLLPKYRGPNPYFWVINNQEQESGVTFHLIDKGFDTGSILAQEVVKIYPSDTGKSLKSRTVLAARGAACELLKTLREDLIIPLRQDEEKSSYYTFPDSLEIDFTKSSDEIFAFIRASYPWYKPYFYNNEVVLTPNPLLTFIEQNDTNFKTPKTIAKIDIKTKSIYVVCGDGKLLKMSDISLYRNIDKPFTRNYMKRELREGDVII